MNVIIDRFENNYAVCETENKSILNIHKSKIPSEASEGDVLTINGDIISINVEETKNRKFLIKELTKDLWND